MPIHVQSSRTKDRLDPGAHLPFNAQEVTPGLWDKGKDGGRKGLWSQGAGGDPSFALTSCTSVSSPEKWAHATHFGALP